MPTVDEDNHTKKNSVAIIDKNDNIVTQAYRDVLETATGH